MRLGAEPIPSNMSYLRRAFELFKQNAQLMRLMDVAGQAEGVRIFIDGESQVVPFEDLSIVTSHLRGGRQDRRHAGRDWPHAHGLRPHDPDCGHYIQIGQQCAQPP